MGLQAPAPPPPRAAAPAPGPVSAGPGGVPPGAVRTGGAGGTSVYRDPTTGNIYEVNDATGQVFSTSNDAQQQALNNPVSTAIKAIPGDIRGVTDTLGITQPPPPDLTKTPAYQNLVNASETFKGAYGAAQGNAAESRGLDLDTIHRLQDAASGKVPSAAEALARKQTDENASQSLGLAATFSGSNPGMALREGLSAYGNAGAKTAADIAALRANEMATARGQLAAATGGIYGTDTGAALGAGNTYETSVAAPFQAQVQQQQIDANNKAANQTAWGTIVGAGGKVLAASDPTLKTNVTPGGPISDEFLDSLAPKSFDYKNPGAPGEPAGRRLGVMATDLPTHDVATGPDGKRWISADVISDILAGMGRLHERQKATEAGMGGGDLARQLAA